MDNSPAFELWLEFEHVEFVGDPYDDFFNMQVKLADGTKYALNVWTFQFFERARHERDIQSEQLMGKYAIAPDLFVEKLDRPLLEKVVAELIETEQMRSEWLCPEDDA